MLTIRLSRTGRENLQQFRLLVQEKARHPKSGKYIEIVGSYNPTDPENKLIFKSDRITHFLKNGAEPSNTVARLLIKSGFDKKLVEKFIVKYTKQKPRKETAAEKSAEAPTDKKENSVEEKPPAKEKVDDTKKADSAEEKEEESTEKEEMKPTADTEKVVEKEPTKNDEKEQVAEKEPTAETEEKESAAEEQSADTEKK